MHVERLSPDNNEIKGILDGKVYIYPKLDGSNHCVWYDDDKEQIRCASRNQIITSEYDPTKFINKYYLPHKDKIEALVNDHKKWTFYGEFMQPHVIRNYLDAVWDDWFVFDVYDRDERRWLRLDEYGPIVNSYGVSVIPCISIINNPTDEDLEKCLNSNNYLLDDANKVGEGIVIKNYGYNNPYGRVIWAKIVRDEFKMKVKKSSKDRNEDDGFTVESDITMRMLSSEFIEKEYYKFTEVYGDWNDTMIPAFISHVYREWWIDYSFDVLANSKTKVDLGELRKKMAKKTVGTLFKIRK